MRPFIYSFGALLIGAVATLGCDGSTNNDDGGGGSGNAGNMGGQGPGGQGGSGPGGQGGTGGMVPGASVDFEAATYSATENEAGQVTVNVVLTLPTGETLGDALTVSVNVGSASTATIGEDVVDPGAYEVTFPAGSGDGTVASFTVTPLADVEREGDEELVLEFAANAMATTGNDATVTITDDDALMIGHTRFIGGGDTAVNMNVDVHDPGTPLTDVGNVVIGMIDVEGAAYDEVNDVTYIVSDGKQELLGRVDAAGLVTIVGPVGFQEVQCLAFDPATGTLYGVDDDADTLIQIDTATGHGTAIGAPGALGAANVEACEFDSTNNVLYAVNDANNTLLTIDTTTGVGTVVGTGLGTSAIESLAYDPGADKLYGANVSGGGTLVEIDRTAGTFSNIGVFDDGATFIQALTFDSTNNVLVGVDNNAESLVEVADDTAAVTHVSIVGASNVEGMAWDAANGILYGVANNDPTFGTSTLVSFDRTTGAFTPEIVLADPDAVILALAHDGTTLYGYNADSASICTIDPTTGAVTNANSPPGTVGDAIITGMTYGNGTLWASTADRLYTVDGASGAATLVGAYTVATDVEGLAYDATNDLLYAIEDFNGAQFFYWIDPSDGSDVDVGFQLGTRSAYALAFDGTSLFALDDGYVGRGALATIDVDDATVTLLKSRAVVPDGMAYDPNTGTIYISEWDYTWLWAHDLASGNTTLVGPLEDDFGDTFVNGLAFDPTSNTLWGASEFNELIAIDVTSGVGTIVDAFDLAALVQGLAWDDATSTLYAASGDTLYTVNTLDASQTAVGAFTNHDNVRGLAWDPNSSTLYGVDQGLGAGETSSAITIDTTTGESTTLRRLGRGIECDDVTLAECSVARGATFAY